MITIAWDIDDVLNELMREWFKSQWLPGHEECELTFKDIRENPPHRLLGASLDEYRDSLDTFRLSNAFQELKPVPEVLEWFRENGDNCHHIALTAVPANAAHASAQWMFRHFGKWIRSFHYIPTERVRHPVHIYDANKVSYLSRTANVAVFIEDNEDNLQGADTQGILPILIPRPWNGGKGNVGSALDALTNIIKERG